MTPFQVLLRYPLFCLPPSSLLRGWIEQGATVSVKTGETIFLEGSPGGWMYVVRRGRVRIVRKTPSGREATLGSVLAGELFGEYALLDPGRNTATCRAAEDCELVQAPLDPIRDWVRQTPFVRASLKSWLQLHFLLRHLRDEAFLGFLSAGSALAMLGHLDTLCVPALRTLQADGLCADRYLFVESGEVLLTAGDVPLRSVPAGESFGESALVGGAELPVAVALEPTRCLSLPREFFLRPDQPAGARPEQSYVAERLAHPSRVRWVGQNDATECGAACLAMIAQYLGMPLHLNDVRPQVRTGPEGAPLVELLRAAESLSIKAQAVRISAPQLSFAQTPFIAHLSRGHYVVVFRIDGNGVQIGDPATGLVTLSARFITEFSGYLLVPRSAAESF